MRNNIRLLQGVALIFDVLLLVGCTKNEETTPEAANTSHIIKVQATVDNLSTRAVLSQAENSLDYSVKFSSSDDVHLFVKQDNKVHIVNTVHPNYVGDNGEFCHFEFELPKSINRSKQMTIIGVCGGTTQVKDDKVYLTTDKVSAPIEGFTAPLAFVLTDTNIGEVGVPIKAKFEHLGVYEAIHIKNVSSSTQTFDLELVDAQGQKSWKQYDDQLWIVSEKTFGSGKRSTTSTIKTPVSIDANGETILYHWYLLKEGTQCFPSTLKLKGQVGDKQDQESVNFQINESINFQKGHIYHIYATYESDGKIYSTSKQEQKKSIPMENVSLNETKKILAEGDTFTLTATITPAEVTNKEVTWKSSSNEIAIVDQSGKVTARKAGLATITVTTKEGNRTATCEIVVMAPSADTVIGIEL